MMAALARLLASPRLLAAVWGATLVLVAGGLAVLHLTAPRETPADREAPPARLALSAEAVPPAHEPRGAADEPAAQRRAEPAGDLATAMQSAGESREPAAHGAVGGPREEPVARVVVAESPDPDLLASSPYGPLPTRSADGRTPFQAYQRPFVGDPKLPRIAILVTHLGLAAARTEEAIGMLPPEVSLAFSPYGRNLEDWGRRARQAGHEVLLMLPMEPLGYPDDDPGPLGLMTTLTPAENVDRLHRVLAKMTGYVGIVSEMGSRFTATPSALAPVISDLAGRGLMVVDARSTARSLLGDEALKAGLPVAVNDRTIDNIADPREIDRYLRELETLALRRGYALGLARPYPISIARIRAWAGDLAARGFVLAPVSAIARTGEEGP